MSNDAAGDGGSSYALPAAAVHWARRVRAFVEQELVPYEEHAELHQGRLPDGVAQHHQRLALELGLSRIDVPRRFGGLALPMLTQVAIAERARRGDQRPLLVLSRSAGLDVRSLRRRPDRPLRLADDARRAPRLLRDHRGRGRLRSLRDRHHRHAAMAITTFISGEKWHVTSFNFADTVIVQARLGNGADAGAHSLFFCPTDAPGLRVVRSPAYAHTYNHHHPVIAFDRVRVPLADRIGAEGDGMGNSPRRGSAASA